MNLRRTTFALATGLFIGWAYAGSPCGFYGDATKTMEERIRDCNSTDGPVTLVMETPSGKKIYRDETRYGEVKGLYWGDLRERTGTYDGVCGIPGDVTSLKASPDCNLHKKTACHTELSEAEGGLANLKWRLPTAEELARVGSKDQRRFNAFQDLNKEVTGSEVWKKLPNSETSYWSSSREVQTAWGMFGYKGILYDESPGTIKSVRCVATP